MSGQPWFKMWKTFATEIKIQEMDLEDQRHWAMLLCLRCDEDDDVDPVNSDGKISVFLRTSKSDTKRIKELFLSKGMIDHNWNPINWNIYQAKGYVAKERMAEMRKRNKEKVTNLLRNSVVTCDENLSQISNLTSVRGNDINTGETIGEKVEY